MTVRGTGCPIALAGALVASLACGPAPPTGSGPGGGEHLGQSPPGRTPQVFAPGVVSTRFDQRDTAWSADGSEVYWTVWGGGKGTIVRSVRRQGAWSPPEIAPFSGRHSDLEPFVAPDGASLYFASRRPVAGDEEGDWDLWVVRRDGGDWGEPERLGEPVNTPGDEFYPTMTRDGLLVFTATRGDSLGGEDIYSSRRVGDGWSEPANLGPAINSPGPEYNALVAPDGNFIVFGSARDGDLGGGDLYVSFVDARGEWGEAVAMPEPVNSPALDFCPALSPDGRYLFFTSRRSTPASPPESYRALVEALDRPTNGSMSVYWVDAGTIDALRPDAAR